MFSKQFVSAIAALGMVTGAVALTCSDDSATIRSQADATTLAACSTFKGSVTIDSSAAGLIDLGGKLTDIGGDLIGENNGNLISLTSSSLTSVGGEFRLQNVTLISNLGMASLRSVDVLTLKSLNALTALNFGTPGLTSAKTVTVADTRLASLEGINVQQLVGMDINNNRFLTKFVTGIHNLSDVLNINANGLKLSASMPNLIWIANMTISNVTTFEAQSLAAVNGSMRFDSNFFESFNAPNLTEIQTGDLSFVSNSQLANISIPLLETVGGGFTIANNTALGDIDGFPALKMVGGAVLLRGSFTDVSMPSLNDVRGTFDLSSTKDVQAACDHFQPLSGKEISGGVTCTSMNANANNATSSDGSSSSDSSSGGKNDKSGASPLSMSMSTVVSLAALGGLVTAFL